jgi:hypothetical protein
MLNLPSCHAASKNSIVSVILSAKTFASMGTPTASGPSTCPLKRFHLKHQSQRSVSTLPEMGCGYVASKRPAATLLCSVLDQRSNPTQRRDWLALIAVHSDTWLLAITFYKAARFNGDQR